MAEVSRVTCLWSGFAGAPGYTKFSFMPLADDTARNAAGTALKAFWDSVATYLPNGVTVAVQPMVDNLDIVSGDLMGSSSMTSVPSATVSATAAAAYAGGSGVVITWMAGGVFAGRRIKGRTFLVPAVGLYENNGTITATAISNLQGAGNALIATAGADLAVWNRQYDEATHKIPIAGNLSSATSCSIRDLASQLRSRRT